MDERTTPDLTAGPHGQQLHTVRSRIDLHVASYLEVADRQREQAQQSLAQDPPDYSAAATACHRALQFTRQANALQQLAREAGL